MVQDLACSSMQPSPTLSDLFSLAAALTPRWFGPEHRLRRDGTGHEPFSIGDETWSFSEPVTRGRDLSDFVLLAQRELTELSSRHLIDSAASLLVIASSEGRFLMVNTYAEILLGYTPEEMHGREILHFLHPDDVDRTFASIQEHARGHATSGFENRYRRKDGNYVWLRWHSTVADNGLIYASAYNVTAEVEQRQRNANLEELHNAAAQLAQMGVYEVDLTTGGAWWSDEVKRIHEVPMDYEPRFDKALEFYAPEAREAVNAAINDAIETGNTWNFEHPFITATGRRIWVRAFGRAEYNAEGEAIALRGGFQEITEKVQQQEDLRIAKNKAEEASSAKSAFMAAMSHEIRNPVNGLLGVLRLLQHTKLTEEQRRLVRLMEDSGDTLTTLLNRVLQLNRLESDQAEVTTEAVDLSALCASSLNSLSALRPDVSTSIDAPDSLWVHGDAAALRQILDNLVSNALKYTPAGSVHISVTEQENTQTIAVSDTGVGIAPARLETIFLRFHRATPPENDGYMGGTGLGLSIARELAELMGGSLKVMSTLGKGSTFTLTLTLPSARPRSARKRPPALAPLTLAGSRALVADDEPISRFVACKILEQWGMEVREARDGNEALDLLETFTPDVVLMDCVMPVLDGWEATRRLRARGFTAPIIALTGSSTEIDISRAFEAGMNDHLSKPLQPETLHARIAYWAKHR